MQNTIPDNHGNTPAKPHDTTLLATWLAMLAAMLGFVSWARVPLAEIIAGVAFLLLLLQHVRKREPANGTTLLALLVCTWAASGLVHGHGTLVLKEIAQIIGVFLVGVTVFRAAWRMRPFALPAAAATGWAGCMLIGLYQRIFSEDLVQGSLGNRPMFSLALAAMAPLVLGVLAQNAGSLTRRYFAAFILLATPFTLTFLPGLILFMLGSVAWLILCADRSWQRIAACCFILGMSLGVFLNRDNLSRSVALHDRNNMTRRWVLEIRAASRAISAKPITGYGPGTYQAVVSSGKFRAFLPPTAENKVERGTQCGYLVLAVEYGLPAAVLVLLALLAGVLRAWQAGPVGMSHPLAISLMLLAAGMLFTPLLVQAAGMLISLTLGCALAASVKAEDPTFPVAGWSPAPIRSCVWFQSSIPLLARGAAPAAPPALPSRPGSPTPITGHKNGSILFPENANVILFEAESAARVKQLAPDLTIDQDEQASGSKTLKVTNAFKKSSVSQDILAYPLTISKPGTYKLWVRAWWEDGCGNSIAASVGQSAPALVGNDGTYRVWHWVSGPTFNLQSGKQT